MTGALVKGEDAPKIQKEIVRGVQVFDDVAYQHLRAGEDQMTLELVNLYARSELMEGLAFERGPDSAGIELGARKLQPNKGVPWVWEIKEMQVKTSRKFVADANSPDAVAMRIKRRRKYADAQLTRKNGDDSSGHAAFGRHTHFVNPFSGVIVHPTRTHYT